MKKIEVEIRVWLKDRQEIENKLISLGAKVIYVSHLVDYWFCPKSITNCEDALIDNVGFALRIRESEDAYSGLKVASLECKKLFDGKDHSLCHEHEIVIGDVSGMKAILDDIGLKNFLIVDKERIVYKYKDVKFCFDKLRGLGDGLEIEVMTEDNLSETKEKIINMALELGIKKEEILEKSLTYLAMQKLGKF